MTAQSIQPTYPIFTDGVGQPLENGFVWIGQANLDPQVNPIAVFWDAALTIPAVQPIRTLAGYPSNSGTPGRLYVGGGYSIRVMNKVGSIVYASPTATSAYGGGAISASDITYKPPLPGTTDSTTQDKLLEVISIKDFGAVGDGSTDDTASIQSALAYGESVGGCSVFVPTGTYKISSTIKLGRYNILQGESRYGSVIKAATKTFVAALDFVGIAQTDGRSAQVRDIWVRDADVGMRNTTGIAGFYGRIENCQISLCRIGIQHFDSYINTICGNLIQNNGCGIVMRGQSYQVNIYDNIIDNNYGGMGIYLRGSEGVVIRDNTIEGNRNTTTKIGGCGIMILAFNQRSLIEGNWFELNCPTPNDGAALADQYIGVDVLIGNPSDALTTAIIENCVPTEYQTEATAASTGVTGGLTCRNNFHYVTKYGYMINSQMTTAKINVHEDSFVGSLGLGNKAIRILGSASGCSINIKRLSVVNTGNSAINTEMNTGIKKSPVFIEGTAPAYNGVTLDDVDIYTAQFTMKEFAALSGASLNLTCIQPTSGTARILNGVIRSTAGGTGFTTVAGTGRGRLRVDGNQLFPATGDYYVAILGSSGSVTSINNAGGPGTDSTGFFTFSPFTVTNVEATLFSGSYFGALVMTPAQHDASPKLYLTKRIQILDLDTVAEPLRSATDPSSYASSSLWNWIQGDIAYNTAPVAGGSIGWVATSTGSGAAANWKTFGTISA